MGGLGLASPLIPAVGGGGKLSGVQGQRKWKLSLAYMMKEVNLVSRNKNTFLIYDNIEKYIISLKLYLKHTSP